MNFLLILGLLGLSSYGHGADDLFYKVRSNEGENKHERIEKLESYLSKLSSRLEKIHKKMEEESSKAHKKLKEELGKDIKSEIKKIEQLISPLFKGENEMPGYVAEKDFKKLEEKLLNTEKSLNEAFFEISGLKKELQKLKDKKEL